MPTFVIASSLITPSARLRISIWPRVSVVWSSILRKTIVFINRFCLYGLIDLLSVLFFCLFLDESFFFLVHEPFFFWPSVYLIPMLSNILKLFEFHICFPQILFFPLFGENGSDFMINTGDGGLARFDCLLIDVEFEEFIACLLRHSFELQAFFVIAYGKRSSYAASTSSTPYSVNILSELCWKLIVDNCLHILYI